MYSQPTSKRYETQLKNAIRVALFGFGAPCLFLLGCDSDTTSPSTPVVMMDRVVFVNQAATDQNARIFHMGLTGGEPVPLTPAEETSQCPAVSPDGRRIAFARNDAAFVMDVDGKNVRELVPSLVIFGGWMGCPSWSPDGQRLAIVRRRPQVKGSGKSELYTVKPDGTELRQITAGDTFARATWAPAGDRLLLSSSKYTDGGPYDFAVSVLSLDGIELKRLAQPWGGADWSPDGKQVAFLCGGPELSNARLCVAEVAGTASTAITEPGIPVNSLDWAPDGKRIAFGCGNAVCTITPDGTGSQTLTSSPGFKLSPVWSPDSRIVVYQCARDTTYTLCSVNDDGSDERMLVTLPGQSYQQTFSPMDR